MVLLQNSHAVIEIVTLTACAISYDLTGRGTDGRMHLKKRLKVTKKIIADDKVVINKNNDVCFTYQAGQPVIPLGQ